MFEWDDLRFTLAVARTGSLGGAARQLGVNSSTVFRRIQRLESQLGARLFDRLPSGYVPTAEGETMLASAQRIEEETQTLDRALSGRDCRLSGTLRVTSSETLAERLLTRHMARFRVVHPGIDLELIVDNRLLSLSKREADIALRPNRPAQNDLFGRKLADVFWAAYAATDYLERAGRPRRLPELGLHPFIGWDDGAVHAAVSEWLAGAVPNAAFAYRSNSLSNQATATRLGIGVALLPCFVGDGTPGLERLFGPIEALARELWIVTHEDLRHTARVRAFMDIVAEGIRGDRALLEGRGAGVPPPASSRKSAANRSGAGKTKGPEAIRPL